MADSFGDLIGRQFGNYRLMRLLGQGGFASVYLGEHIHLNTPAAIKILHASMAQNEMEHFLAEARMIATLDHPHIVRMIDFGLEAATPYLILHYAPNGTLRTAHREGIALPLPNVIAYVRQIASGLQYAHDRKLVHRDVKPENILLSPQNELWLSDFGIALITRSSHQQSTKDTTGTLAYMAPEQSIGKPVAASDQYALGIMTYEWLVGMRPFQGNYSELIGQHFQAQPPSICARVPTISPAIEQVVMRALAKNPQERFPSVQVFADALEQAYMTGQVTVASAPPITNQPYLSSLQAQAIPPVIPTVPAYPMQTPYGVPYKPLTETAQNISWEQSRHAIPPSQTRPVSNMQSSQPYHMSPNTPQYASQPNAYYKPQSFAPPPVPYTQPPMVAAPPRKFLSKGCWIAVSLVIALVILPFFLCVWAGVYSQLTKNVGGTSTSNTSGTPNTSFIPTPLPVTSNTLYNADWSKDPGGWTGSSEWKWVEDGTLNSDGTGDETTGFIFLAPYQSKTADYVVEAQIQLIRFTNSYMGGNFGIMVRSAGGSGYICAVDQSGIAGIAFGGGNNTSFSLLSQQNYNSDNGFHTFRVEVKADSISMSIDGQPITQATDSHLLSAGLVGLRAREAAVKVRSFQVLKVGS